VASIRVGLRNARGKNYTAPLYTREIEERRAESDERTTRESSTTSIRVLRPENRFQFSLSQSVVWADRSTFDPST
jgi:hypothetical protein